MRASGWVPLLALASLLGAVTCRAGGAAGCDGWLKVLRAGAEKSLRKSRAEQRLALLEASSGYFSQACMPRRPGQPASELLHVCLGSDYPSGEFTSMLEILDAASYLYGKALQQELEKAGLYAQDGRRMLANFFLSSALVQESEAEESEPGQ